MTSYITARVFNRWRQAHRSRRVVTNGDDLFGTQNPMRLIEVSKVAITGWSVGPLWLTERPDGDFHSLLDPLTDKSVAGAVGANVFQHFVMTLDYPRETAGFRCVTGCKHVATPPPAP